MGVLGKTILQSFIPYQPGTPGWPGSFGDSAGYSTSSETYCTWDSSYDTGSDLEANQRRPAKPRKVCTTRDVTTYSGGSVRVKAVPPTEETPEQTINDFQLGWNARANSLFDIKGPGEYSFTVPVSAVGVVVGMVRAPRTSGYGDIEYAFIAARGQLKIIESGVQVLDLGAQPNALLSIRRTMGNIEYRVAGTLVRTRPNTSDPLILSAAFFSGGDTIVDADMLTWEEGIASGSLQPLQGYGGDVAYAIGEGAMLPMESSGLAWGHGSGAGVMRKLEAYAADETGYAGAAVEFMPLTSIGDGFGVMPFAIGKGQMFPMIAGASGTTGTIGGGAGIMRYMEGLSADHPYASGIGGLLPLDSYAENYETATEASIISFMEAVADTQADVQLFVLLNSSMQVTGLFTLQTVLSALIDSGFTVDDDMTTSQVLKALLASIMDASIQVGQHAEPMTVWALNMDINGSTRYEDYDFNSFAELDGVYYGARSDGIYKLEGRDDSGTDVSASVNFGNLSFGSINRKALPYLYAGVASDGNLRLKVVADGQTYYYTVRDNTELLKAHRFELGKGLQASYYDITILNDGGAAFQLTDIEFFPLELKRRL